MGKHKEKTHKRKHEDSDSASNISEEEAKRHKDKKAKKHKKEKKEKKSKRDDKEKELLKAAKKFLKTKLKGEESQPPEDDTPLNKAAEIEEITADDYFIKNAEFSEWLRLQRGQLFNDLTSEQARSQFVDFIEAWNSHALPARYYKGVAGTTLRRTKHAWAIKGSGATESSAVGLVAAMEEDREAFSGKRAEEAAERKKWRAEQRETLDELLPKAMGREARIDQKMARREAAKEREGSPEMTRLPGGGDVMGGDDSLAAAKAREAKQMQWKARKGAVRQQEMQQKLTAAQEAEAEKMAQFRALVAQGPLSIARRPS